MSHSTFSVKNDVKIWTKLSAFDVTSYLYFKCHMMKGLGHALPVASQDIMYKYNVTFLAPDCYQNVKKGGISSTYYECFTSLFYFRVILPTLKSSDFHEITQKIEARRKLQI